jgi:DNA-directed RNA polymerase specialized sigma24 family protein
VTLSDENLGGHTPYDTLDVDALLEELGTFDNLAAEVVSLRIFGGLSIEEAAEAIGVSVATINRRWLTGKAWLTRELIRNA